MKDRMRQLQARLKLFDAEVHHVQTVNRFGRIILTCHTEPPFEFTVKCYDLCRR